MSLKLEGKRWAGLETSIVFQSDRMKYEFFTSFQERFRRKKYRTIRFCVCYRGLSYVDHPSFGHAIISRVLEAHGYTVGIISQPDWKDENSIAILGNQDLVF